MTKILLCWEDKNYQAIDRAFRRVRRHFSSQVSGECQAPALFPFSVRGHGGFQPFINNDWPIAHSRGLLKSAGPIDHTICIADADRATECCDIEKPPKPPESTDDWIRKANVLWTERLRGWTDQAPDRIHGCFIRWNRESIVIAGFDNPAVLTRLADGNKYNTEELATFLKQCGPDPSKMPLDKFVDEFRTPTGCLAEMIEAMKLRPRKKTDQSCDDAINEISKRDILKLSERVPDLTCIARLVVSLSKI